MCVKQAFVGGIVLVAFVQSALAQYPRVSQEVQEEANRKAADAERRSDEAWEKALPTIRQWEARGKPYLPGAARPADLPQAAIPAFPGAQGGGMYSHGGRGGRVFVVTNLDDRGPGSFREACEAPGPRIVVFNVAGIIRLAEKIRVRAPYITIDGGTAPGDGVCIAGDTVEIDTHDVVIRHMRFRRGETWVGDRNDSLGGNPIGNVIVDHVSASWGLDENLSMYRHMYRPPRPDAEEETSASGARDRDRKLPTVNITIQNSIFSECLNTYNHSFGSTLGGYNSTFHHNLWASNAGRNPSIGMHYDFTFANNVLYNWRHRTVDGGDQKSFYTITNNYFKPGPVTPLGQPISYRLLRPDGRPEFGKAYVAGNIVEGNAEVTADNWAGGVQVEVRGDGDEEAVLANVRSDRPYPHAWLDIEPADEAYEHVLANAGATRPKRDAVDERIIHMVRTGTVTASIKDDFADELRRVGYSDAVIDGIRDLVAKGIITDIEQVGGYPDYRGAPYADADGDGMPDDWERQHGLDPHDPSDAAGDLNGDGYTNIESLLYGLDPTAPKRDWPTPRTYEDMWSGGEE